MPRAHETAARVSATALLKRSRVRWRIFTLLAGLGAIAYFQQKEVTIAAEQIMPQLSLSQMQIGWLQWAFVLGYTPTQILAGRVGEMFGARRTLTAAFLIALAATIALPLAPRLLTGSALFAGMLLSQLLLGIAQSPTFPVGAGVVRAWLPVRRWALASGVQSTALQLGAAATPPVIALLMQRVGWQQALLWSALPMFGVIVLWARDARDAPRDHPGVDRSELELIGTSESAPTQPLAHTFRVLLRRDLLALTLSYLSMNYVYYLLANWSFLYLVQERHLGVAQSGWLAALPPLGAALGAGLGGAAADGLAARYGARWGVRLIPLLSLPVVAVLLLLAVFHADALIAVSLLTLCYALIELNEGPFWAATMRIAGARTMTATGFLNTGGAAGGLLGIPIVAYLSGHGAWTVAFGLGSLCALGSALGWFAIDCEARGEGRKWRQ